MPSKDKRTRAEQKHLHYVENKEDYQRRQKEQRKRNKEFLREQKAGGCVVCGEKECACLDFHHLDPSLKTDKLTSSINRKWSLERIIEELKNCIVLCANCHRKVHAGILQLEFA